jgi:Cu-Zn family superoxide dismutase
MKIHIWTAVLILPALTSCANGKAGEAQTEASAAPERVAYAQLVDATGAAKARAVLTDDGTGVDVALLVENMAPGTYAFHIHETGTCTPPDFKSAGAHFNPTNQRHGAHKGDLPNVTVGADGKGQVETRVEGVSLAGGDEMAIVDADGAAMMIHAHADDGMTDPSGNAGARIACGPVIVK